MGGSSNLGGWLLRSNFSDDELVELTDLIDLDDAEKEKDVPDYYPGVLMGFGMTVKEATEALCPRPESDADYLRGEFLFISVWAIGLTMSCFVYYIQIRRMPSFPSASWRTSSWNWTTRADERAWAPGTSGPRSVHCTRHSWTRWDRV